MLNKLSRVTLPLFFLVILTLLSSLAFGQAESGTIAGTVKDSSGAVIPNATVTVKNLGTGAERAVQTNTSGQYTIPSLTPGHYEVTAKSGSFAAYKGRGEVTVGGRLTIDPILSVSSESTTVEVVAEGGTAINTQTQEISQIISPAQVEQLPSLTRNPYDFVAVSGNVSAGDRTSTGGGQNNGDRGVGFNINGQRSSGTEILLDGVENSDLFNTGVGVLIPQDSVQEFRVITNNFDAQYGRASGGVITVSTKSGTNNFHGTAWEFNRLSAYTANTYDNAANGAPKGNYTRNQFGYAVGGPVLKNKLFFFQSTEWTRVRSNASVSSYVPTPELIAASDPTVQAYFQKYGANKFTFSKVLTASQVAGLSSLPANTPALGLVNFTAPFDAGGGLPQNTHNIVGRVDYNYSDNTQMFFRYGLYSELDFNGASFYSPYSQYDVGASAYNNAALFSLNHSYTPNLLSNTKVSFTRLNTGNSYNTALQNTPTLFVTNNANVNGQAIQLPGFYDGSTGNGGLPYGGPQNVFQLNHDLSWTKGKHNMRFGGQFNYEQINRGYGAYAQASELLGKSLSTGMANFLTGTLTSFTVAANPQGHFPCARDFNTGLVIQTPECTVTAPVSSPTFNRAFRYQDWAVYGQDSWRLTERLTFNYGLRYEYYGIQHNTNQDLDSNFYYGLGTSQWQQIRNGAVELTQNGPTRSFWKPNYGTFAPRVGFAYDVFGDGKTSLRGGMGLSYERNFGNVTFNVVQNPPNNATVNVTGANAGKVTVNNLGPLAGTAGLALPLPPSSPRHIDQNIDTAQTQFWSLAVERQVAKNTLFAVEYNGAHGVHLYDIKNNNELGSGQVYLGDAFNGSNYSRLNPHFTSINTRGSNGYSHYNGLNLRFQSQNLFNTGLSIVSNYTWAHSLDNTSSTFSESSSSSNGVGNLGYLDPRNPALDYGNSDFDIRHRLSVTAIWEEPFFKNSHGWKNKVLGGYSLMPIFTARTGIPFTISDSTNSLNGASGPYGIVRYTPGSSISSYSTGSPVNQGGNVFNVMSLPGANSWVGLLGISDFGPYPSNMTPRNAFRGPGAWNADLALSKKVKLTEKYGLEFRAEGFNIFNHHNYYVNGYIADVAASTDANGKVFIQAKKGGLGNLAAGGNHDERRFGQFALRFTF